VCRITATLNQDRTAIDHNSLTGAESFLHQKQIGLGNIMSFCRLARDLFASGKRHGGIAHSN
jgi:hypothetical protein